ncbi:hypothetical protein JCM10213_007765, partial [Rhodosporidiobolus nylandii]
RVQQTRQAHQSRVVVVLGDGSGERRGEGSPSAGSPSPSPAANPRSTPSPAPSSTPSLADEVPWPELRDEEVSAALFSSRPFAAPGADGLPNALLQLLWPALRIRLVPLFAAAVASVGHLPRAWRDAVGLVLRKPKKPDHSIPKADRLISFERTLAKLAEKLVARRGAPLNLISPFHFGGRRGVRAEEAVVCAADTLKRQHRKGRVVVGPALDAEGAFPNTDAEQLDRDLQ